MVEAVNSFAEQNPAYRSAFSFLNKESRTLFMLNTFNYKAISNHVAPNGSRVVTFSYTIITIKKNINVYNLLSLTLFPFFIHYSISLLL